MAASIDPYHKWLGIPPAEQPPHHYRLLSINLFETDLDVIDSAANRQMTFLRECGQGPHSAASQRLLNEVSTARVVLLNPQKKEAYDHELRSRLSPPMARAVSPQASSSHSRAASAVPRVHEEAPLLNLKVDHRARPRSSGMIYGAAAAGIAALLLVAGLAWQFSRPETVAQASGPETKLPAPPTSTSEPTPKAIPTETTRPAPPVNSEPRKLTTPPDRPALPEVKREDPKAEPPQPEPKSEPKKVGEPKGFPELEPRKVEPDQGKKGPKISTDPDDGALAQADPKKSQPKAEPRKSEPPAARTPIPPKEALTAAEKLIKELFKAEYASRKPEERASLAKKLLSQGIETTDDPTSQYVLLSEAREVAGGMGETETALNSVDQLAKRFEINSGEERFQTLSALSRSTRTAEANQVLLDHSTRALEDSVDADEYDLAKKLATLAGAVAKKAQNVKTVGLMATRLREIEGLKKDYDVAKEAHATLKATPDDASANLIVGKFLCFSKGDFDKGLEHLAKGSDENLKSLAERDLAKPKDPTEQVALADQWWTLGEKEKEPAKGNIQQRAVPWYTEALPSLKGLTKTQVEAKLKAKQSAGGASRKRALAELLMSTTWKVTVTHGTYPQITFEANGNWKCSGGPGSWVRDGENVVVTFPSGAYEVYKLVNGKILIDHFRKDEKAPSATGFAVPWDQQQQQ